MSALDAHVHVRERASLRNVFDDYRKRLTGVRQVNGTRPRYFEKPFEKQKVIYGLVGMLKYFYRTTLVVQKNFHEIAQDVWAQGNRGEMVWKEKRNQFFYVENTVYSL